MVFVDLVSWLNLWHKFSSLFVTVFTVHFPVISIQHSLVSGVYTAKKSPDAVQEIEIICTALIKIRQLVQASPQINGNGSAWRHLADRAEADRSVLCKLLDGKALFTGLMHL
jgi:hypothetical protein